MSVIERPSVAHSDAADGRARSAPEVEPSGRPRLRVVDRRSLSPQLRRRRTVAVATVLVVAVFSCLFALTVLQTLMVQNQLRLDQLNQEIGQSQRQYEVRRLEVAQLEAPERIAAAAGQLGMVPSHDVTYVVAPPQLDGAGAAPDVNPAGRAWGAVKPYLEVAP